jgi:hypothetical protein
MKKKTPGRGGRRKGAGRPKVYAHRGKLSVVMEQALIESISAKAKELGLSVSQTVSWALHDWLEKRP